MRQLSKLELVPSYWSSCVTLLFQLISCLELVLIAAAHFLTGARILGFGIPLLQNERVSEVICLIFKSQRLLCLVCKSSEVSRSDDLMVSKM